MRSKVKSGEKFMIHPWSVPQRANGIQKIEELKEYPFLKAAIEDIHELQFRIAHEPVNRRHVVCLMFDAIEFVLYEILVVNDCDIYKSGQNTIGFNDALQKCQAINIEIPLIGAIRQIQKNRGDAKHHAQTPDETAYERLLGNFEIVFSRLINEQFEGIVDNVLEDLPILSHQVALFETYRRRRNHNWKKAYRFALGALIRKHQEMFGKNGGMSFNFSAGHQRQLHLLEEEVSKTDYLVAPADAAKELASIVTRVREALADNNWKKGADLLSTAYSTADRLLPGIFDIDEATQLSSRLFVPRSFSYAGPMAWGKVWGNKGSEEARLVAAIEEFLQNNESTVKKFGNAHFATDEDRYWKWWEFALFDGERWHTFHLDSHFMVSLESGPDISREQGGLKRLLALILDELKACASVRT